ncbi:DUF3021 domain-containing protein [Staphylococcus argensis]|uniref:DUF3021 domain-containing protein n=1 Tax=Staphylococcus argensis TaxID=1607738 RepID=A0A2K4FB35_9STAP|nr:DUF3021 domain-containing protein [Staphylococcus argensis]MCY6991777.1 DUF3021 domain-containing protein [Staphylococcus argensis]POA08578.1 DUF3021 domain-containing protein [Staphylococcus argensis]
MRGILRSSMLGIMIGLGLSLIFSFIFGHDHYYPQSPVSTMGQIYYAHLNEPMIMLISIILWALVGILFFVGGLLYERTEWSLWKITIVHFILMLGGFFPLAILAGWFPLKVAPIVSFVVLYIIIYSIIWLIQYQRNKKYVAEINRALNQRR